MDIVQLVSAAGIGGIIGSLLTSVVQSFLAHKSYLAQRNFQEKKDAYMGLLTAYHKALVDRADPDNRKEFAHWQMRCDLVAPRKVRDAIQEIVDANTANDTQRRIDAHENLKKLLRDDLGVEASG
jgi:hypothetical protein